MTLVDSVHKKYTNDAVLFDYIYLLMLLALFEAPRIIDSVVRAKAGFARVFINCSSCPFDPTQAQHIHSRYTSRYSLLHSVHHGPN